jgi:hypothetical protein
VDSESREALERLVKWIFAAGPASMRMCWRERIHRTEDRTEHSGALGGPTDRPRTLVQPRAGWLSRSRRLPPCVLRYLRIGRQSRFCGFAPIT